MTKRSRHRGNSRLADLYLLGIGINGFSQATDETLKVLGHCRKVFDLSDQHRSIRRLNPNTKNLDRFYWTGEDREVVYKRLVRIVLDEVRLGPGVALVGYGHPLLFDDVCAELRRRTHNLGLKCIVYPGISCLDTLCIDLGIDYGDGLQIFDTTELVQLEFSMCVELHTILFQVYEFGEDVTADAIRPVRGRFAPLEKYLSRFYPVTHPVTLAYSEDGSGGGPVLVKTRIRSIDKKQKIMFPGISLYIPPYKLKE